MADSEGPVAERAGASARLADRLARVDRGWWATVIGLLVVGLAWAIP
ncbi:MAG: hypothetical protein U5J98_12590 [Halobacteriales archaeon]|nr:hypothetical protein [Halobacteriales archaeon]